MMKSDKNNYTHSRVKMKKKIRIKNDFIHK